MLEVNRSEEEDRGYVKESEDEDDDEEDNDHELEEDKADDTAGEIAGGRAGFLSDEVVAALPKLPRFTSLSLLLGLEGKEARDPRVEDGASRASGPGKNLRSSTSSVSVMIMAPARFCSSCPRGAADLPLMSSWVLLLLSWPKASSLSPGV